MLTSIPSLSYNYYHNKINNNTYDNEQQKRISSYQDIPSLEGQLHYQSNNGTNGTITFPLKAKILRNMKNLEVPENMLSKGSLLFCLVDDQNNHLNREEDVCTIVDLETLNVLLVLHYGKKENEKNDEKERIVPYWKQWNFVGYLRNELHQTTKTKGYRLLNVDVSGVTQTKNYWNHNNNDEKVIKQGSELLLVLKKQWVRNVGKFVYQWITHVGFPQLNQEVEFYLRVGSILENKNDTNKEFLNIFV